MKIIYLLLALLLASCNNPQPVRAPVAIPDAPADSATELAEFIRTGQLTSQDVVAAYLARIDALDRQGPELQTILTLNPNALEDARILDAEAKDGNYRGVLHGVPVLVKDNIETREMPTTAGSMALAENATGRDSPVVARLRAQGAIILGKTNLSEWANFRSNKSISGWSGIGGLTRNPHSIDRTPCGSSSGSAAAVAARLAPLSLGTETNGSITCPAAMNGVVGFKPTVGLLSQKYIVPISSTQDTAGPITRTVRDAALMMDVMAGSDARTQSDYVSGLDKGIAGMRIGVFRWAEGKHPAVSDAFNEAVSVLKSLGAELVEITKFEPDPVMFQSANVILETEFKHTLNLYLADASPGVKVRSLADLIAFNRTFAERELALFDQSILLNSEQTKGVRDSEYLKVLAAVEKAAREKGLDQLLNEYDVEVLVMPSRAPASPVDVAFTTRGAGRIGAGWLAAMAGYPVLTVPMGNHLGLPIGLGIMSGYKEDATVLVVGYAYEQASDKIVDPTFAHGPFEMKATGATMRPHVP